MTNTTGQLDKNFPVFELGYSDSLSGGPKYVRSKQGMLFVKLTSGGAFNWINLRIVSSHIPLKLKYKCVYKQPGTEVDLTAEALEPIPKVVESDESFVIPCAAPESSTEGCRNVET